MKKIFTILSIIIFSGISLYSQVPENFNFNQYINYLASDSLEGRLAGTAGAEKASKYILNEFKTFGLKAVNNLYQQDIEVVNEYSIDSASNIYAEKVIPRIGIPKEQWRRLKQGWKLGLDYIPMASSASKEITGNVLFACYGITAPELNYDDYNGVDAKGKIVIIIMDSPEGEDKCEKFCNYSSMNYKIKNAQDHGAIGIVFIRKQGNEMNKFLPLKWKYFVDNTNMPIVMANRTFITKYIPSEHNLMRLEDRVSQSMKPESFDLGDLSLTIKTSITPIKSKTSNVFGMVEGTDPTKKGEFIVVGAHYDHIGYGVSSMKKSAPKSDKVHNGANDNASSVAVLLELAKYVSANPLPRSVIFTAFTAEEMGMLGSKAFAEFLSSNNINCISMINMEMVGKNEKEMYAMSSNTSSVFPALLDSAALHNGITLTHSQRAVPSDHSIFIEKKIPAIIVFGGFSEDYHTALDDANKINFSAVKATYFFTKEFIYSLGLLTDKPTFNGQ